MARKSRKQIDGSVIAEEVITRAKTYDVGAYVRLSAVHRKQKGDSIEIQQAIISAYIAEHPDLVLREVYIDNGITGTTFERPAFKKMLEDAENGKISCLISKDFSRLGRSAINTGFYIEKYFPTHGIRYIAINDGYDSNDPKSGGIMVSLKNMVNETYALEVGRKIRTTKQMNIRNGSFVGKLAPYGYRKSDDDKHKLVIDNEAAINVHQMYEMIAGGGSVTDILNWLNESGVLPPKHYHYKNGTITENEVGRQALWNKGVVYGILRNRIYCGDMVQGKYTTIDHLQKKLPENEWVITENTHEPIVDKQTWEYVQKALEPSRPKRVPYSPDNIFKRKVFCAHCGYTMCRSQRKDEYTFVCNTRHMYHKTACVPVAIRESELRQFLLDMLVNENVAIHLPKHDTEQNTTASITAELRSVQHELNRSGGYLKSLYESLHGGDITTDEYRDMKLDYEAKITELTAKEKSLRDSARELHLNEMKRQKAAANMSGLLTPADLTAEVIAALVERIDVSSDKSIAVTFRFASSKTVTEVACNE